MVWFIESDNDDGVFWSGYEWIDYVDYCSNYGFDVEDFFRFEVVLWVKIEIFWVWDYWFYVVIKGYVYF